jgi:hypothetical protein
MRNVLDKRCRENKSKHFMFSNVFPKIVALNGGTRQAADENMAALCMLDK